MAQPAPYVPSHEFLSDEAANPRFPGTEIDYEFNALQATLGDVLANIALIQRDDGEIANNAVHWEALDEELQLGAFAPISAWGSSVEYHARQLVVKSGGIYRALDEHISGVSFADDVTAGHWVYIDQLTSGADGETPTVTIGTVTGIEVGAPPTVTNSGSGTNVVLDFEFPTVPGGGDVNGPGAVVTSGHAVLWDGTSGALVKTAGFAPANVVHTHDDRYYTEAEIAALLAPLATLASPTFTGNVVVPNQSANNNSTKAANTAYVDAAVALIAGGTIADDSVTNAKLADMAAGTVKANATAGAANPTDVTYAALKTAMAFVAGDVGLGSVDNTSDTTKNTASVALTNKTIGVTNAITAKDSTFSVVDDGDNTKQFRLQVSGVATATIRTWTVPDSSDTFVGKATTDVMTNKTLTSPNVLIKETYCPTDAATTADQFVLTGRDNATVGFPVPFFRPVTQNYIGFDVCPNHTGGVVEGAVAGRAWMDIVGADFVLSPTASNWSARAGAKTDGSGVEIAYFGSWKNTAHAASVPVAIMVDTSTEVARFSTAGLSLSKKLNFGVTPTLTIASGVITPTTSNFKIDTQSAAATDDLDTISGGVEGDVIFFRTVSSARDVVIKNGSGNILNASGADITLTVLNQMVCYVFDGTNWRGGKLTS